MNKIMSKPYIPYLTAFLGAWGLQGVVSLGSGNNIRYSNSVISLFVFALSAFILGKIWKDYLIESLRHRLFAGVFSLFLSLSLHFGSRLETVENVRFNDAGIWIRIVCLTIYLIPIVSVSWTKLPLVISGLYDASKSGDNEAVKPVKYLQIWAIIFLLWLPVFFALYPGAFVYDAQEEYIEVISRQFNMHHPLLHVLALGGTVHAAEYLGMGANAGIAAYVLIQMALMSAVLAYLIKKLEYWGLKKAFITVMIVFVGLFPIFPMYAVCTAKDGLFTAFLLLVMIEICQYVINAEDFNPTFFTLGAVLMMLMRNNGVYAFLAAMVIFLISQLIRSDDRKRLIKIAILTLLSFVLYFGSVTALKIATHAQDNEHQEILTVPIQQLGRTYVYSSDEMSEGEKEELYSYLPEEYLKTYRFRLSDILKSGFNNAEYDRDSKTFWRLWASLGIKKPAVYLNAWLGTSYGYWYPDALNNVYEGNQMYTFRYEESSYFGFETEPPGKRDSRFPILEKFYENISLRLFQQRVPLVSQLFSPGFMWWLCAYVFLYLLAKGGKGSLGVLVLLPAVMVWLTVLLGPTTLVRYVLILWFMIPIYPVLLGHTGGADK